MSCVSSFCCFALIVLNVGFDQAPTESTKRRFRLWGGSKEEAAEPVGAVIGAPYNVQHVTHVKPDSHTSTGFTGLPSAWRMVLKASGITKEEAVEHPQAVLDALAFHMDGPPRKQSQAMPPQMPTKQDITKTVTEVCLCRSEWEQLGGGVLCGQAAHAFSSVCDISMKRCVAWVVAVR